MRVGWAQIGNFWPLSRLVSPKLCKIAPGLLLTTNKSHTRFRLEPKSMALYDRERPLGLRTLLHYTCGGPIRRPPGEFE